MQQLELLGRQQIRHVAPGPMTVGLHPVLRQSAWILLDDDDFYLLLAWSSSLPQLH